MVATSSVITSGTAGAASLAASGKARSTSSTTSAGVSSTIWSATSPSPSRVGNSEGARRGGSHAANGRDFHFPTTTRTFFPCRIQSMQQLGYEDSRGHGFQRLKRYLSNKVESGKAWQELGSTFFPESKSSEHNKQILRPSIGTLERVINFAHRSVPPPQHPPNNKQRAGVDEKSNPHQMPT